MIVVLVMKLILPMRMMIEIMIVIVMAMLIMTRVKMIIMISIIIITITKTMMHPSMKALTATFRLQLLNSIYTCKQTTSRPQDSSHYSEIPYYQGSMLEIITLTLSVM